MTKDLNKEVGLRIKNRRIDLGMTLRELGECVDLSEATIQRYESGKIKGVDINLISILAQALQTTPAYLMGWEDSTPEPPAETEPEILEKFPDDIVILARGAKTLTKHQIDLVRNLIDNMNKQNED